MQGIKIVLFDLDNTLWDHTQAQAVAIEKLAKKYNLPGAEFARVYKFFNEKAWQMFARGVFTLSDMRHFRFALSFEALGEVARGLDPLSVGEEYLRIYGEESILCPYADTVLQRLSEKFTLGILTNGFRDIQMKKIKSSPIGKYLTYFFSADEVQFLKPDERYFKFVLDRIDGSKDEIVYVGDSFEEDIIGGKKAGLKVIWYNPEKKKIEPQMVEYKPDAEITDLRELIEILE